MKRISHHVRPSTLLGACIASAVLIGGALAQPPKPGGGGGGPGAGPGAAPAAPGAGPGGGPGPGAGGPGGAPSPTFNLRFCNKTSDVPVIFITTAGAAGQQFRAQGWVQIPQGQCVSAGSYQRPSVWWHGRAPNGTTWGDAKSGIDLCVNLNGGFDYTWDGSARQCGQGENSVPFMKLDIQPQINNFDMNLN